MKISLLILLCLLSGCANMTEQYWQEKWASMSDEEKEARRSGIPGEGMPIAVCDLTDCYFVWIYY